MAEDDVGMRIESAGIALNEVLDITFDNIV